MIQFDHATGTLLLPMWGLAVVAALVVILAIIAVVRAGAIRTVFGLFVLAAACYGVWAGSIVLDRVGANDRVAERRAFEQRTQELIARALLPGSPLSCLDQPASEQLSQGCEKVVFGSPENIAAAVSYTHARLSMLIDGLDAASRGDDTAYESSINTLRRGLEGDRFGVVAHLFLQNANCRPEQCEMLALLRDPNKVRVNLQEKTFDVLVARNAATWAQKGSSVAEMPKVGNGGAPAMAPAATGGPVSSKYDFPSANSIPPVSIMNTEPPQPSAASSTTPAQGASAAAREPRRPPGVRPPAAVRTEAPAPVQLAPAASAAPASAPAPRPAAQ